MMNDTLLGTDIRWVYCLPCRRAFELEHGRGACRCGRSEAMLLDDGTIQVQGPAKAMTPLETVVHVDGGEWALVPEDVTVRRVLPPAA
jgi:hypothetical protein